MMSSTNTAPIDAVHFAATMVLAINRDERGSVREAFRASWLPGLPPIMQIVHSESGPNVMRAMHAHKRQYDIWHFTAGEAQVQLFDPFAMPRPMVLWVKPDTTLIIPPGTAHGFYTPNGCTLTYYLTEEYDGTDEFGFYALDPKYPGAQMWASNNPVLSTRDQTAPLLAKFKANW